MSEFWRADTLAHLALWLLLAAGLMLIRLLPLGAAEGSFPAPDVLLALTLAWVLRRPVHLPAPVIVLVFLIEDLFLMRPPGLWALAVLLGSEFLRRRQSMVRELNLLFEWVLVAGVLAAITLGTRLVRAIVMLPNDPLDLSFGALAVTILSYPVVVWVLQSVLRVRKPATGEVDELGRRL